MDPTLLSFLGFGGLFLLIILRVPIGVAMGVVGVCGFAAVVNWSAGLNLLVNAPYRMMSDYSLSVVPMFVLMGVFAGAGGLSRELFDASNTWLGHVRGGLATATVAASGGFAAINGSSVACAATMTTVALPEMRRAGYAPGLAAGVIAAGGTLGSMIPPSVFLLLYGIITEQNVAELFMAGVIPGLLGLGLYALVVQIIARRRPDSMPHGRRASWGERFAALRGLWATLLLFALVIIGMYGGFVTVTEAAGVGAVGALLIGVARGKLPPRVILRCLVDALQITAAIFTIAVGATLFGYFLTVTQVTQNLTTYLTQVPLPAWGVLGLILLVYLALGAVMDELAVILLTVPIVFPAMQALGFDPIWFGIVLVTTISIGLISPPVGMNVFVINSIARDVKLTEIYRGVLPFVAADLVRILALCLFPALALWLPGTM
ncbi:Sialic acid TRAP transporter permease protein SiaT [Pseudooceanicola marinus]|uniref:TRAP transporter large permease protein n=1 Tax=Pseudooceanicola marinus TaxID=396013 RepID=A0A1X7A538_9RHOB|nr:TRAP transporter large permease [Pseudooceanicola marinus]PJE27187.1 TRAP transporter large permease [Pseudooceanicola marinus]SLN70591.1 Sialic acid TRAP transporter permease protein SiaT [Pseudooceanicola marinus]